MSWSRALSLASPSAVTTRFDTEGGREGAIQAVLEGICKGRCPVNSRVNVYLHGVFCHLPYAMAVRVRHATIRVVEFALQNLSKRSRKKLTRTRSARLRLGIRTLMHSVPPRVSGLGST